jgi:peptide/nickel transport system permease protein
MGEGERGGVGGYAVRRALQALFVLWAAYTASFVLLYALPRDPVSTMTGGQSSDLTAAQLDAVRHEYGLDRPLAVQYVDQLAHAALGDLGRSVQSGRAVRTLIVEALPHTAGITGIALVLALAGGGSLAVVATGLRHRTLANLLLGLPPLGVALPTFWVGLLLLQQFVFTWHLLPSLSDDGWRSLVLPSITLAIPTGALIAQVLARSLQQTLREPFVDAARAKGASEPRVQLRHALRNACLPALTMAGLVVGTLLSGSVVVETVFSRPGLGRLTASAVENQDIPVVQGLVLFSAAVYVVVSLLVDVLSPVIDPRLIDRTVTIERPTVLV